MKDIYIIMNRQNILNFYGSKLDLKLDSSELYDFIVDKEEWVDLVIDHSEQYDFIVDTAGWVDLVLDYSEEYDFQLDSSVDNYSITYVYVPLINTKYDCDWSIITQDNFSLNTQNGECIQYEH